MTPTIKEILAPLQPDMARTDEVIRRELHSDVALVRSVADYIIAAGGKRLRPALLLAVLHFSPLVVGHDEYFTGQARPPGRQILRLKQRGVAPQARQAVRRGGAIDVHHIV